jgi:imidazolonepropionase-like amidohydrolase
MSRLLVALAVFGVLGSGAGRPDGRQDAKDVQASLVSVPAEVPKDAARYDMLLQGNKAGVLCLWRTPDGARHAFFEFNDRGRGPRTLTRAVDDAQGLPVSVEISGHDYLKAPIDEHFSLEGGKARWKSQAESGEKVLSGPSFYGAFSADPGEIAVLARALLKTPSKTLPLLPEGSVHLTPLASRMVRGEAISEYEISGLDFTPSPVWLTKTGDLFAVGSGWFAIVREGTGADWPALAEVQEAQATERGALLAKKAARREAGPLVFTHANVFDSARAVSIPGTTVVLSGREIADVGPDGKVPIPAGARVVDASGKALLPGLVDMHVHLSGDDGVLHIASGITSVRDMANDIDQVGRLKAKYASLELVGPRVMNAGFVDSRGPYQGPTKVFADTSEEAVAAIERYKSLGYEQIKVYSSLKPELFPGIAAEAHKRGLRVSGHVPAFMTAAQFIEEGADEIQHINFIVLNFFFDEVKDTRTPARFTAVAEHAAELDLSSERVRSFVKLMLDHKTVLDPTVNVFEEMFLSRPGVMDPVVAPVASRLPAQVRRGYLAQGLPVPEGKDERYRASAAALLKLVKLLYDSGVPLVAGTDALAGFVLPSELDYYVQAGIPAPKVLQIATLGAARVMHHDDTLGSIEKGKLADVILVDGDPASHIGDIRKVVTVVKDGVVYDPAVLYASLGVAPR